MTRKEKALVTRLGNRTREIHRDILNELRAQGASTEGPDEWDSYLDTRRNTPEGKVCAAPTPAYQEAWRRACAELPEAVAVLETLDD